MDSTTFKTHGDSCGMCDTYEEEFKAKEEEEEK
jgi:hypothetical protein